MKNKVIVYKSFNDEYEALYAKKILEENGIECFISGSSTIIVSEPINRPKLHIFEKDIEKVNHILKN